jgi:hypothetical protein
MCHAPLFTTLEKLNFAQILVMLLGETCPKAILIASTSLQSIFDIIVGQQQLQCCFKQLGWSSCPFL